MRRSLQTGLAVILGARRVQDGVVYVVDGHILHNILRRRARQEVGRRLDFGMPRNVERAVVGVVLDVLALRGLVDVKIL